MFIVEDGTGLPNSNSYTSVAFASSYLQYEQNIALWNAKTTEQKEGFLQYATRTLDEVYVWKGTKLNDTQALNLPTNCVTGTGGVNLNVQKACALIAFDYCITGVPLQSKTWDGVTSVSVPDLSVSLDANKLRTTPLLTDRILTLLFNLGGLKSNGLHYSYIRRF